MLAFIEVRLFYDHAPVVLQVNDGTNWKPQGRIRIRLELFTEPLVTEQVRYIWRQTLLQTGNVEDNVVLAILHISNFLISWAQGKRKDIHRK